MPDPRAKRDRDRMYTSRAERRDKALVVEYIHELSDRHGGAGADAVDREHAGDGPRAEEGG